MISRIVWVALAICGVTVAAAGAQVGTSEEEAPTVLQIRNFDHLEFDTVTGTYFGVAGFYTRDDKVVFQGVGETEQESTTAEIRLLIGGSRMQAGLVIPYHVTSGDRLGSGQDDVGDIRTHLKFIPMRTDLFDLGGGLMLTFPGGGEDVAISTGEVGVLPFVTGTAHAGPVDVNLHIGYEYVNHRRANGASESILYGGTIKLPIGDQLGLRLEFAGQQYKNGDDRNVAAVEPGIDFLIPVGGWDLQLSASGAYGLSGGLAGGAVPGDPGFGSRWGLNSKSGLSRGEWGAGAALGFLWN